MRTFGVELEISRRLANPCYHKKKKRPLWDQIKWALSQQHEGGIIGRWRAVTDTSCGGELVSPPLYGMKGLREVAHICNWFNKEYPSTDRIPNVDFECGLHLHFDASDISPQALGNIFVLLHALEPFLFSTYNNRDFDYCAPIDVPVAQAKRFRDWQDVRYAWYTNRNNVKDKNIIYDDNFINSNTFGSKYDGTRYHGFNIHCIWSNGTIEFRYANGTLDFLEVYAYYRLCLSIINTAMRYKRIFEFDSIKNMDYRQLNNFLVSNFNGRDVFKKLCRMCKFDRPLISFLLNRILDNNPNLLKKNANRDVIAITEKTKHMYYYRIGSRAFNGDGKEIPLSSIFEKHSAIPCYANNKNALVPSNGNIKMFTDIMVQKDDRKINQSIVEGIYQSASMTNAQFVQFLDVEQ